MVSAMVDRLGRQESHEVDLRRVLEPYDQAEDVFLKENFLHNSEKHRHL